jgi:hypothetical protein
MTVVLLKDASPVGTWDRASWIRIVSPDPALIVRVWGTAGNPYTPEERARVIFGRWPS